MRSLFLVAALAFYTVLCPSLVFAQVVEHELSMPAYKGVLPVYSWGEQNTKPQGILVALHGSVQNGKYLSQIGKEMAQFGFLTYAPDFRGHGKWLNEHSSEDIRNIDYVACENDVRLLVRQLRQSYRNTPVFAIGESVGAAVALSVASKERGLFDGLILCSAGSKPMINDYGSLAKQIVGGIASGGASVDISSNIGRFISDDVRARDEMMNDPNVHKSASVQELLHTALYLRKAATLVDNLDYDVPVLMLQGLDDKILNPNSARTLFSQLPNRDKQLIFVPGCGHLLVTGNFLKPQVVNTVGDWLAAHATTTDLALHSRTDN